MEIKINNNSAATTKSIPRIFIQYNCIAHYRIPVFDRLCSRKDFVFHIIANSETDISNLKTMTEKNARAIRHMKVKTVKIKLPAIPPLDWQPEAVRFFVKQRPDILIALAIPYSLTAWVLLLLGKWLKIPVLLWGHGLLKDEKGIKWLIRGTFYRLAAGHLLYGNHAKKLLIQKGLDPEKLFVIYNSLDYEKQKMISEMIQPESHSAWKKSLGIGAADPVIIFTGRLQKIKRLDLLIDAIVLVKKNHQNVHLVLIGEGPERASLERRATVQGVGPYVHFLGELYDEEKIGLAYSSSDLCVIPAAVGLTVMHAMVYGTPVLTADKPCIHGPEVEA